jgi:hypothetical protein
MRKRLLLTFIVSLLIGSISQAQAGQNQKERYARDNDRSDQITPEEVERARDLADRFIRRLRETRDLTPLVSEMFTSNFKTMIAEDASWSGIVGQGRSLVEHVSREQRLKCFIVNFNLQYLIRLYIASKLPLDSEKLSTNGDIIPPALTKFFKDNAPPEDAVETTEQARIAMSLLERAVALMQDEVAKNPPEQTEQFKTNLAAFEAHLKEHVEERPSVRVYDQERHGLAAGTRLIRMVIPFHVGLAMVPEKDGLKLELAATQLPPP